MSLYVMNLTDFVGSLSVMLLLALAYSTIQRTLSRRHIAQPILGAVFGAVTLFEMHMPVLTLEGVLIDMRNVPIALAGAFLGRRGLAVCLLIAISSRVYLGGAGAPSGVMAMLIAAGMGRLWHNLTFNEAARGFWPLLGLAVMMSIHVLAGILLPPQAFLWFFRDAAPQLVALNLMVVPLTAWLLERERKLIRYEGQLRAAATADPDTGLLPIARFARELGLEMAAGGRDHVAGLAVIRVQHHSWLLWQWGQSSISFILGGMRIRLNKVLPDLRLIGITEDRKIVVPLTTMDLFRGPALTADLEQAVASDGFSLPGGLQLSATVEAKTYQIDSYSDLAVILGTLRSSTPTRPGQRGSGKPARRRRRGKSRPNHPGRPPTPAHLAEETSGILFEKAALLMSTR